MIDRTVGLEMCVNTGIPVDCWSHVSGEPREHSLNFSTQKNNDDVKREHGLARGPLNCEVREARHGLFAVAKDMRTLHPPLYDSLLCAVMAKKENQTEQAAAGLDLTTTDRFGSSGNLARVCTRLGDTSTPGVSFVSSSAVWDLFIPQHSTNAHSCFWCCQCQKSSSKWKYEFYASGRNSGTEES